MSGSYTDVVDAEQLDDLAYLNFLRARGYPQSTPIERNHQDRIALTL
jgi:hypothetical protein